MLPELQEELLSLIFSYLALPPATKLADIEHWNDQHNNYGLLVKDMKLTQQTFFNICLVSKTLYRLAWPALYRAYSTRLMGWDSMSDSYFLRTLCLNPKYGKTLRSFSARSPERIYDHQHFLASDAMTIAAFQWRARNLWLKGYEGGQEFQDRLVRSLLTSMDDGITCMVLLVCPNITELEISLPWDPPSSYLIADLFAVITSPQTQPPPTGSVYEPPSSRFVTSQSRGASWPDTPWQQPGALEYLSELTLHSSPSVTWEPLLASVTLLPSLKTLRIYKLIVGPSQDWLAAITRRKAHHLQTLHLPECYLGDTELCGIIQLFPRLRTLNIGWAILRRSLISMNKIGRAVASYTPQLMHLTLDASLRLATEGSFGFDDDRRVCDTLCDSIKDMQHLAHLKVNEQAIWSSLHFQNSRDPNTESREPGPGIRYASPTRLAWLEIVSPLHLNRTWDDPYAYVDYQRWQDCDLRTLLLDESFTELERVDMHNCRLEMCTSSVRERGWTNEAAETERGAKVERLRRLKTNTEMSDDS